LVWKALDFLTNGTEKVEYSKSVSFGQHYWKNGDLFKDELTIVIESGQYENNNMRHLLIGAVAGAAEKSVGPP
jgi:hypothetical protein